MSKDKGGKNVKKAPAGKSDGKVKTVSDYKLEGQSGYGKEAAPNVFSPKPAAKGGKSK